MIKNFMTAIFGTRHERELKRISPIVDEINKHYELLRSASDSDLKAQTAKFRTVLLERTGELENRIAALKEEKKVTAEETERSRIDAELAGTDGRGGLEGELRQAISDALDEMLPEAFATVREGCRRLMGTTVRVTGRDIPWDMIPYDVQLIGGYQLHEGKIAEMATGEGKTLVATLPLYLNALAGKGTHLVTVNSYLARRDAQWMGHVYSFLGLTVGCLDDTEPGTPERRAAYLTDITYGTNNEFGFDYLRDNMVTSLDQRVQRAHWYAIVDEVDSVLIDEARTPLIISGPVGNESDGQYREYNASVARLVRQQSDIANGLVAEAERAFEKGDQDEAALRLYQARLGAPKNRRLLKVLQELGAKQLVQKMELDHIADRKVPAGKQQFRDLEERLLFVLDEKGHTVHLTDQGVDYLSPGDHDSFVLPDISESVHRIDHDPELSPQEKLEARAVVEGDYAAKSEKLNIVHQLLRAHALYEKDVNYVVQEGQVLIVDEFTGRTMPGRRWSEGLHQAVEAKEGVQVKGETQTMATITIQNYFRMYDKLAGMTGTAETEETEFHQIYGLDAAVIPTNKPVIRDDRHDLIYKTRREKYNAIVEEARRLHELGFPVLVGTVSVEVSETLERLFKQRGLRPNVLNAKYHQREAEIVADAGQPGTVTIATNMAGRGTDIKLGPGVTVAQPSTIKNEKGEDIDVTELGGLHIIGSERHESRRIDRQLRGRAGRQGDPGASQFFLSLEDDLMRLFGSERIAKLMDRMGAQEGEVLTHPLITRSIEQAQKRVELQNFQARKRLLEYDDVMNQQREVIYSLRSFALEGGEELKGEAVKMVERALASRVEKGLAAYETPEDWDLALLRQELLMHYLVRVPEFESEDARPVGIGEASERARHAARDAFDAKLRSLAELGDQLLALVTLNVIDEKWKDHLYDLDQLRAAIHYRSWGQKDPLIEYKHEAYTMFVDLMGDIHNTFAERFLKLQIMYEPPHPPEFGGGGRFVRAGGGPGVVGGVSGSGGGGRAPLSGGDGNGGESARPTKRFNAFGIVEDIPLEEQLAGEPNGDTVVEEEGPAELPTRGATARRQPIVSSGGRMLAQGGARGGGVGGGGGGRSPSTSSAGPVDWTSVGRNDPCPCGSGKKFKKCHGAGVR